jgi:hypothetical protein
MHQITAFPHAHYNAQNKFGYLCFYYPFDGVRQKLISYRQWNVDSCSPQILEYKNGQAEMISSFLNPFTQLLKFALSETGGDNSDSTTHAYLVPVPASRSSIDYSHIANPRPLPAEQQHTQPKPPIRIDLAPPPPIDPASRANCEFRNLIFCRQLTQRASSYQLANILYRTINKPARTRWSTEQHTNSLTLAPDFSGSDFSQFDFTQLPPRPLFILVDDIVTSGGTLFGCEAVLKRNFPECTVIKLALALTRSPHRFLGLGNLNTAAG